MDGWTEGWKDRPSAEVVAAAAKEEEEEEKKCLKYLSEKMETAGPGLAREKATMAEKNLYELYLFLRFLVANKRLYKPLCLSVRRGSDPTKKVI